MPFVLTLVLIPFVAMGILVWIAKPQTPTESASPVRVTAASFAIGCTFAVFTEVGRSESSTAAVALVVLPVVGTVFAVVGVGVGILAERVLFHMDRQNILHGKTVLGIYVCAAAVGILIGW